MTTDISSGQPAGGTPAGSAGGSAGDPGWSELVQQLPLAGVARMIAEHSELLERTDRTLRLRIDSRHDALLSDSAVAGIERAFAELGESLQVQIEVGAVSQETPAERFARLRQERQAAAEQTLAADRTVQSLLSEFGGQLDGVRPIE